MPATAVQRALQKFAAAAAVLSLVACTPNVNPTPAETSPPDPSVDPPSTPLEVDTTFTFATAADPKGLDPALALDTESYRVTRQILQTLVAPDPVTGEPIPNLAVSWEEVDDGLAYSFELREGVTFHDGTPFNAEAVCANFERWYNLPVELRRTHTGLPFQSVFKAFFDQPDLSVYKDCVVEGAHEMTLELTERYTGLVPALTMPAFGISSPTALAERQADKLTEERGDRKLSQYALHPVGTGPFTLESWEGETVVLGYFDDYWGSPGQIRTVVFSTIARPAARREALIEGRIDGYDLVTADSFEPLVKAGMKVLQRDPFSVLYLGINQDYPPLEDPLIRQALTHAIDKQALVEEFFINGTGTADQFVPQVLDSQEVEAPTYEYDVEAARALLEQAGYSGKEITFYYPRNVTRAYLPNPENVYTAISRQLRKAGFNIKPIAIEWSEGYIEQVQSDGAHGIHLLGWSGSYRDPDHFIGTLFGTESAEFGFSDAQLFSKIARARTLPEGELRLEAYENIKEEIAENVPAIPLAFPISALALSERVESYPVSPVLDEVFNEIVLNS